MFLPARILLPTTFFANLTQPLALSSRLVSRGKRDDIRGEESARFKPLARRVCFSSDDWASFSPFQTHITGPIFILVTNPK